MKKCFLLLIMVFLISGCGFQRDELTSVKNENEILKNEVSRLNEKLENNVKDITEKADQIKVLEGIREGNKIDLEEKDKIIDSYKSENKEIKDKNVELAKKLENKKVSSIYWILFVIINNALWFGFYKKK